MAIRGRGSALASVSYPPINVRPTEAVLTLAGGIGFEPIGISLEGKALTGEVTLPSQPRRDSRCFNSEEEVWRLTRREVS